MKAHHETRFTGRLVFKDQKQLTASQFLYLRVFRAYCHGVVRRNMAKQADDPVRTATGLPLGPDCCFFLDSGVLSHWDVHSYMLW